MPSDIPARVPLPIAMPDNAFGAALIEQAASLSAYARRLTGGGADADDLLQDTMLRCWTARASFAAGTSLAAWTRTVMKNCFLTGRRRARTIPERRCEGGQRRKSISPSSCHIHVKS